MVEISKEAQELIKEIKFGNKVDLGAFDSQEKADEFVGDFMSSYPEADKNVVADKEKALSQYKQQEEKNEALGLINHIFEDYHNRFIPQMMSGAEIHKFREKDSLSEDYGVGARGSAGEQFEKMPKEVSDIVYPHMQKSMMHRLTSKDPHDKKQYPKTPYKEVPLQKRLLNNLYKVTKSPKFDSNIELMKKMDLGLKMYQDTLAGGGVFSDTTIRKKFGDSINQESSASRVNGLAKVDTTNNKTSAIKHGGLAQVNNIQHNKDYTCGADYLKELVSMPYEQMLEKVDKDYDKFAKEGNELAVKITPLAKDLDKLYSQNKTHDSIKETLDTKFRTHFALQKCKNKARINLAQKGTMSNEDIKEARPKHGAVKVDETILKRQNEGR